MKQRLRKSGVDVGFEDEDDDADLEDMDEEVEGYEGALTAREQQL